MGKGKVKGMKRFLNNGISPVYDSGSPKETPQVQEFDMHQYPTAFELMLEIAKREPIYCNTTGNKVSSEKLFKAAEKAEILIFYPTKEEKEGTKPIKAKSEETRIDCPYPVCSLELYHSGIRFSEEKPSQRLYNLLVIENQAEDMEEVYGLIHESRLGEKGFGLLYTNSRDKGGWCWVSQVINSMLERLQGSIEGQERVNRRAKLGTGKGKRLHKIKRVVHVLPKKQRDKVKSMGLGHIDFTHKFMRRGHWRVLEPIEGRERVGKDRLGKYTVKGKTWVTHTTVGDKRKNLVTKTRVIHN